MGLFDFLKKAGAKSPPSPSSGAIPDELVFKSGKDAIGYVQKFMRTDWVPGSMVTALLGPPSLENGILSARVLIPTSSQFREIPTFTKISAVGSRNEGKLPVTRSTQISALGLQFGDLVTVALAEKSDEVAKLMPDSSGWIAFVVAKNSLSYSMREQGWRVDKIFDI